MSRFTLLAVTIAASFASIAIAAPQTVQPHGKQGGIHGPLAMDTNKDGKVSRTEAIVHAEARFAEMDMNKDGFVDQSDLQARMQQRRTERFTQMDTNNDGRITRAEFDAKHTQRMNARSKAGMPMRNAAEMTQRRDSMFAAMDTNKDGSVSRQEFDAAKNAMPRAGSKGPRGR